MAACEFFAATTPDLALSNIKNKAEAYGWTIDFFGTYNGYNRLHLHNSLGSHFELWWYSSYGFYIAACTGYSSGAIPTAQPGISNNQQIVLDSSMFVVVCPSSIFIKVFRPASYYLIYQFGTITEKIGAWEGGTFMSSTLSATNYNSNQLWATSSALSSQVLINGAWSTLTTTSGGAVFGVCESELYTRMPFAYCGGIMPVPMLLVQRNPSTSANLHPLGYAPDVRFFAGGTVYVSLEEMVINGETWVAINQSEIGGTFNAAPDLLIRLAS